MKTMQVNLDKFELVNLLESCARGSHLRQHIWRRLVTEWLSKMSEEQMDFTWWVLWRDVWSIYFKRSTLKSGAEDFLHAMAALNRNNYREIYAIVGGQGGDYACYEFGGRYYLAGSFDKVIEDEAVAIVRFPEKEKDDNIPSEFTAHWWNTAIYNENPSDLLNIEQHKLIELWENS